MSNDNSGRESGPTAAAGGTLGNNTKFVFSAQKSVEKYRLLSLAKDLLPDMRIRICMAHMLPQKSGVDVNYNHEYRYAWITNLQRCACAWICAFCATRKSEQDRADMKYALEMNIDRYVPVMVTLTMGHKRDDRLEYLLEGLLGAYRAMQQGRDWKLLVDEYGLAGTIRSLEITYSVNGWHPHFHVLWLLERPLVLGVKPDDTSDLDWLKEIAAALRNQLSSHYWRPSLIKLGFYCTDERGVDVQIGHQDLIEYIEKHGYAPENPNDDSWDVEAEMTRRTAKDSKDGGLTMWDLLRNYGDGDKNAGKLFREYALATKGKNPLRWSPGLRDKLKVIDTPEEETLSIEPEIDVLLCYMTSEQWAVVRKNRAQGELVRIASQGEVIPLLKFLNALPGMEIAGQWLIPKGVSIDKYRYKD